MLAFDSILSTFIIYDSNYNSQILLAPVGFEPTKSEVCIAPYTPRNATWYCLGLHCAYLRVLSPRCCVRGIPADPSEAQ